MNEAIKLAIEKGGYEDNGKLENLEYEMIILDPLFWQALGKALGWTKVCGNCGAKVHIVNDFELVSEPSDCGCGQHCNFFQEAFIYYALRYHELNLTGGDTEKFFKELIE